MYSKAIGKCPRIPPPSFVKTVFSSLEILSKIGEDGYLHIVGRSKDLIILGGYNIYPKKIEIVLDD